MKSLTNKNIVSLVSSFGIIGLVSILIGILTFTTSYSSVFAGNGVESIHDELVAEVKKKNVGKVRALLKKGAYINYRREDSLSLLQLATRAGDLKMTKLLYEAGANINFSARYSLPVVLMAAQYGHEAIVDYFISKGIAVNAKYKYEMNLLMASAAGGLMKFVDLALANKVDVNALDINGQNALHYCVRNKRCTLSILKKLLANKVNLYSETRQYGRLSALILAVASKRSDFLEVLLSSDQLDIKLMNKESNALTYAISRGYEKIIIELLATKKFNRYTPEVLAAIISLIGSDKKSEKIKLVVNGEYLAKISEQDKAKLLVAAVTKNNASVIKLLADNGQDVSVVFKTQMSALKSAMRYGQVAVVVALIKTSKKIDPKLIEQLWPSLIEHSKDASVFRYLKNKKFDVTKTDAHGRSGLIFAAKNGSIDKAKFFVKQPTLIEAVSTRGYYIKGLTSLKIAARSGHVEIVELLLKHKAKVNNVKPDSGDSALEYAIYNKKPKVIELLLKFKTNPNLKTSRDQTMLSLCIDKKLEDSAMLLVNSGAKFKQANRYGGFILTEAINNKLTKLAILLIKKGANLNIKSTHKNIAKWETPLANAVLNKEFEVANALLDAGAKAKVERRSTKLVTQVITAGKLKLIKKLYSKGFDVNEKLLSDQSYGGRLTPLNLSLKFKHTALVNWFLKQGASPNLWNSEGRNSAFFVKDKVMLTLLIKHGLDINHVSKLNTTALTEAILQDDLALIKLLLEQGANPENGFTEEGYSNLMAATFKRDTVLVKLLLKHGAKANRRSPAILEAAINTPLHVAESKEFKDIQKLFQTSLK